MGLTDILAHPFGQVAVTTLAETLIRWVDGRSKHDDTLERINGLIAQVDRDIEAKRQARLEGSARSTGTGGTGAKTNLVSLPQSTANPQDTVNQAANTNSLANIGTACLPCTRAHLLTVAGSLKEALRFAREDQGVNHPEVQNRLDTAAEEIVVMERYDLAPEKVANAPKEEQAILEELLPKIRTMRQKLLNDIKDVDDLKEVAQEAVELYKRARAGPQIDWQKAANIARKAEA